MTRVLALMKYGTCAASTRQRLVQYIPYLETHDVAVELSPLLDNAYLENLAKGGKKSLRGIAVAYLNRFRQLLRRDFDILWVQYELLPYFPGAFERLLKLSGRPVVVDMDDAFFHAYDLHPNPVIRHSLGSKFAPLLRGASLCICGNEYLEGYARRFAPATVIIPTVVDTRKYVPEYRDSSHPLVVGWIGSPSTWRYVEPLLPVMLPMLRERNIVFRAVGAGPAAQGIPGVEAVAWTEEQEIAEIQRMDVGIMPVPDDPWSRGKCGYKLIQYMACGLPTVASPVGVNARIVVDGETGFLARTLGDWPPALRKLLDDPALRRRMGSEGRVIVDRDYSLVSQQDRLLRALQTVAGVPRYP